MVKKALDSTNQFEWPHCTVRAIPTARKSAEVLPIYLIATSEKRVLQTLPIQFPGEFSILTILLQQGGVN